MVWTYPTCVLLPLPRNTIHHIANSSGSSNSSSSSLTSMYCSTFFIAPLISLQSSHSPHASPILSQHLPAPHTSSSSSSHDPFDSLNTSFSRYPSDIGGSRSTGTTQQQHPSTNNNPGSSPYARSSGMKDVGIRLLIIVVLIIRWLSI